MAFIAVAILWGVMNAVQSPTNASLGKKVGSIQSAMISCGIATVLLFLGVLIIGSGNVFLITTVPIWQLTGGLYGAIYTFGAAFCVPNLGVALTLTVTMLGQMFAGIVTDVFGWLGVEAVALSPLRIVGALLAICGISCMYISKRKYQGLKSGDDGPSIQKIILCIILMFFSGAALAFQAPTNSTLARTIGGIETSLVSLSVSFLTLLILTLIVNRGRFHSVKGAKPWEFLGGLYGSIGNFCGVVSTPFLGVALVMTGSMFGQLVMGTIVDTFGLFRSEKLKVDLWRIIGIILFVICIILTTLGRLG